MNMMIEMVRKIMRHLCADGVWYSWYTRFRNRLPKCCPRCKAMLNQASVKANRKSDNEVWFYRQEAYDEFGAPSKETVI